MDLLNASLQDIKQRYDSRNYTIPALEWTTVSDAAGHFMLEKCKSRGLVMIRYNDDIEVLKLKGMTNAIRRYEYAVEHHKRTNMRQDELKFPPVPKSQMVRESEEQIPALKKAIAALQARVDPKKAKVRAEKLDALTEKAIELPGLAEMTVEDLRDEARKEKIEFKNNWTRKMFIDKLTEKASQVA